ncbi:MAG: hypothetical protein IKZ82_13575 [Clostridia bacterium]|nr:hypothetical protein [Clostridia bacterium]
MKSCLYTPLELALIIRFHRMDSEQYIELLQNIHRYDNIYVQPEYRHERKKFILDVMDRLNYFTDPEAYLSEQSGIERDMNDFGLCNNSRVGDAEHTFSHLIFKELRLRILYINKKGFAKMKLRTLLSELGYKRRSPNVIVYICDCLLFYHIETTLKGNEPCRIDEIDIDETVIFRAV